MKIIKLLRFEDEERAKHVEIELKKDPNILYVAKNFKVMISPLRRTEFKGEPEVSPKAPTVDPLRPYQWYLFKTKRRICTDSPSSSNNSDRRHRIHYDHEERSGRVILRSDYVDGDEGPKDENGHGTTVAGIINNVIRHSGNITKKQDIINQSTK